MYHLRLFLRFCVIITAVYVVACGDEDASSDESTGDKSSDNTNTPSQAGSTCGDVSCKTDLDAAMALLKAGEFSQAFEEYKCGDTIEAAFGAALTQFMLLWESDGISNFMARAGYNPIPANQIAGPDSLLARNSQYWEGTASLTLTGDNLDESLLMENVHTDFEEGYWEIDASKVGVAPSYDLWLDAGTPVPLESGDVIEIVYNCESGDPAEVSLVDGLYLSVSVRTVQGADLYCDFSRYVGMDGECPDTTGKISIDALDGVGDPAVYTFTDVPLSCVDESTPYDEGTSQFVAYLSGTVESRWTTFDTNDLHPFLNDPEAFWESLPMSYTASDMIADIAPIADDLTRAACYAELADNGNSGQVFEIPSEFNGRHPVPISTADAKSIAAGLLMSAAGIRIAESYDYNIRLRALEEMDDAEIVDEINNNLPALKDNHKFEEAKYLFARGLALTEESLNLMGTKGILQLNQYSSQSRDDMLEWVGAALDSIENGPTAVPQSDPPIEIDLGTFFDVPPDPSQIDADAVVLEVGDDGYTYIEGVEVFYQELLGDTILDFSYEMEENFLFEEPEEYFEDFVEDLAGRLCDLFGC